MTSATHRNCGCSASIRWMGAYISRTRGWAAQLCSLVAHHSGARFVAAVDGLEEQLAEVVFTVDRLSDALTLADQTTGPRGDPITIGERLTEMHRRHGPDSPNARADPHRAAYVRAAYARRPAYAWCRSDDSGFN
jgi:hypothetical protein